METEKNKFKVLIIEDDNNIFNTLKRGLESSEYKVWRATSGNEALKLFKDTNFMVVISEAMMPDITGTELVRRLKRIDSKINVITLTTYSFASFGVETLEAGAYAYLLKPLNIKEVMLFLRRAIENTYLANQARQKRAYKDMSILDGLTGVYNHRYFDEVLDWHVAHLRRHPQALSLFMIDIDNFKRYNDTKGHPQGDRALSDAARLFSDSLRDDDQVFRYGGEEFTIIMPQTPQRQAIIVGDRLIASVRVKLPVTISVGLSTFPDNAQTKKELIGKADKALYQAKALGRDRLCAFDERAKK